MKVCIDQWPTRPSPHQPDTYRTDLHQGPNIRARVIVEIQKKHGHGALYLCGRSDSLSLLPFASLFCAALPSTSSWYQHLQQPESESEPEPEPEPDLPAFAPAAAAAAPKQFSRSRPNPPPSPSHTYCRIPSRFTLRS